MPDIAYIPLTQGQVALIDAADLPMVGRMEVEYRQCHFSVLYRIGSDGSVWSRRSGTWKRLSPLGNPKHLFVYLHSKKFYVHRLVLEAFIGPAPLGCECRHLNSNPKDNRLENLQWGTQTENNSDRYRMGTGNFGERMWSAKLTSAQVREIRASTDLHRTIARRYGISRNNVSTIKSGGSWKYA